MGVPERAEGIRFRLPARGILLPKQTASSLAACGHMVMRHIRAHTASSE